MTKESTILLLECKLQSYKSGLIKANERNDLVDAKKWKKGYTATRERIYDLKQK